MMQRVVEMNLCGTLKVSCFGSLFTCRLGSQVRVVQTSMFIINTNTHTPTLAAAWNRESHDGAKCQENGSGDKHHYQHYHCPCDKHQGFAMHGCSSLAGRGVKLLELVKSYVAGGH